MNISVIKGDKEDLETSIRLRLQEFFQLHPSVVFTNVDIDTSDKNDIKVVITANYPL